MTLGRRQSGREEPLRATVLKGGALLTVLVALFVIGITATRGLPGVPHYTLRAQLDDAGNLAKNADVRMFGKRIGQVLDLNIEGGKAVIDLQLKDNLERLPIDTRLRVRSRSLLGDRYVDVVPGKADRRLADGDMIPAPQTSSSVQFADFLDAFDPRTRAGLKTTIDEFGRGLVGRGKGLNTTLRDAPPLLEDTRAVAGAVLARPGAAARFAPSLESAAAAADPVRKDIARGFDPAARSLQPLSDHRPAVQALLGEAAQSFPVTRAALAKSDPLLAEAGRFARAATQLLDDAPPAFRSATSLLQDSQEPLRRTDSVLRAAADTTPAVLDLVDAVDPVIPRGRAALRDSVPWLRTIAQHECDLVPYAEKFRSWTGFGTPGGEPELGGFINVARLKYVRTGAGSLGGSGPDAPIGEPNLRSDPYPEPCRGLPDGAQR